MVKVTELKAQQIVEDLMSTTDLQTHKDNINRMFIDFLCHPDNKGEAEEIIESIRYTHYCVLSLFKDLQKLIDQEKTS